LGSDGGLEVNIYFETYGCALNKADTSLMKSLAVSRGHRVVEDVDEADVVVVNTCTVRLDTELKIIKRLSYLYRQHGDSKKIVVAGCMASAQPYTVKKIAPRAVLVSPQNITKLLEAVESGTDYILGERDTTFLKPYLEGAVAAVPIAEGCVGNCSFCITKLARRRLRSYGPGHIVGAVRDAVEKGAVEVELTAQDTGSYGLDIGDYRLPDLVRDIVEKVPGSYMLRIGMTNPDTLAKILDGVIEILREPKVFKYLHIPLQSADDRVLKIMRRRYTYDEFKKIVREIRQKVPTITIATDIIVGHPGEDDEAFRNTIRAVAELQFDKVHIAQYTIRPRTEAASMPQVPEHVKKLRSTILSKLVERIGLNVNREYVGSLAKVVITGRGFRGGIAGRTLNYKPVILLEGIERSHLGKTQVVKIADATFYDLRGQALRSLCP
jgi:MiaB-like tRNA modifying enzyme